MKVLRSEIVTLDGKLSMYFLAKLRPDLWNAEFGPIRGKGLERERSLITRRLDICLAWNEEWCWIPAPPV